MKFTPFQARQLASITEQTLRYWKRRLPPIAHRRGQTPSYTHGDLIALMVVRRLVHDFDMDVRYVARFADSLFTACNRRIWPLGRHSFLVIGKETLQVVAQEDIHLEGEAKIVVPLNSVLDELTDRLSGQDVTYQLELNLPPVALRAAPKSASR